MSLAHLRRPDAQRLHMLARRDATKAQVAVISVCVVLIVVIGAGVAGWFLWRIRRSPKRVRQVHTSAKSTIRIDDGERNMPKASFVEVPAAVPVAATVPRGIGGIEGWLQSTQRTAPIGPQEVVVPRTPRTVPGTEQTPPTPPATAPLDSRTTPPLDRPNSPQSFQPSDQGHAHQGSQSGPHARPFAFIKNIFGQPQGGQLDDLQSDGGVTPTVARLPIMSDPERPHQQRGRVDSRPNRPMRSDSLVLSQSAYEIYPDASASQYGGRRPHGRSDSGSEDIVPPMPSDRNGRSQVPRRQSYGALSSQGGLPLPSFYLPSEQGDSSLPGALPIGESVLASPIEAPRQHAGVDSSRRGGGQRKTGSNFVVTNATHSDDD